MFINPEKPVKSYLYQQSSPIQHLLKQYEEQQVLNAFLQTQLPSELGAHVQVGYYQAGCLTVFVDHSTWGTLLQYQIGDLTSAFRKHGNLPGLVAIQVKVRPRQNLLATSQLQLPDPDRQK